MWQRRMQFIRRNSVQRPAAHVYVAERIAVEAAVSTDGPKIAEVLDVRLDRNPQADTIHGFMLVLAYNHLSDVALQVLRLPSFNSTT